MRTLVEFKVISTTGDGCSANRKFFRICRLAAGNMESTKPTHKIKDAYSNEERFITDVPHLLKTVCETADGHSHSRALWVSHSCKSDCLPDSSNTVCTQNMAQYKNTYYSSQPSLQKWQSTPH